MNVNDESLIIELSSDLTKFRSRTIKSYYDDNHTNDLDDLSLFISIIDTSFIEFASLTKSSNMSQSNDQFAALNNQKSEFEIFSNSLNRDRDGSRKYLASMHFWALCSIRLSISFSLSFRFRYSLSLLSSIQLYTLHFFNSSHSEKKRSTNSSKKMFFS